MTIIKYLWHCKTFYVIENFLYYVKQIFRNLKSSDKKRK